MEIHLVSCTVYKTNTVKCECDSSRGAALQSAMSCLQCGGSRGSKGPCPLPLKKSWVM